MEASMYTFPIDVYEALERKLGKEEAKEVVKYVNDTLGFIDKKATDIALQKKLEIKDELSKELASKADILVLKSDIALVRQEIQTVKVDLEGKIENFKVELEGKMRTHFLILLFVIVLVSPRAMDLIGSFLGIIK